MAWAEREVELVNGLDHDRGLAVVQDAGLATAHVRWADQYELAAWRAARREERLVRQERRSFEGYRERDGSFERYVDVSLAPRMVTALDLDRQRGVQPSWATLHTVAARYGCELGIAQNGCIAVRDVGIGEMRAAHEQQLRNRRSALLVDGHDPADVEEQIRSFRARLTLEQTQARAGKQSAAFIQLPARLQVRLGDLPAFQDAERSEQAIIDRVDADPQMSSRTLLRKALRSHERTWTNGSRRVFQTQRLSSALAIGLFA